MGLPPLPVHSGHMLFCLDAGDRRISGRLLQDDEQQADMIAASVIIQNGQGDWVGSASGLIAPDGWQELDRPW